MALNFLGKYYKRFFMYKYGDFFVYKKCARDSQPVKTSILYFIILIM